MSIHSVRDLLYSDRADAHTMLVFLTLNGIEIEYEDNDFIHLVLGVASGEISDIQLLEWLKQHIC